jgi:hypothetical protein
MRWLHSSLCNRPASTGTKTCVSVQGGHNPFMSALFFVPRRRVFASTTIARVPHDQDATTNKPTSARLRSFARAIKHSSELFTHSPHVTTHLSVIRVRVSLPQSCPQSASRDLRKSKRTHELPLGPSEIPLLIAHFFLTSASPNRTSGNRRYSRGSTGYALSVTVSTPMQQARQDRS